MNTLEALYFPATAIHSASQYPAFLLLDTLHLLQPVERTDSADNKPDIFITSGLCQEYTPRPLGTHRDRFLRLLKDIRERHDDYAAQLSSLTLASLSARKSSVDDSEQGIVSSLLGRHGLAVSPETEQDELLWQSRLVLKIAELLDEEEEEVAMQMAMLDDQQDNLLKVLQGDLDEEDHESLLEELQQIRQRIARPASSTVKNRLGAWARLYLADNLPGRQLWLTHQEEAADLLLEEYEKTAGEAATIIGELPLPANIGWARQDALDLIREFRNANGPLLADLASAVSAVDETLFSTSAARWEKALAESFPAAEYGRCLLTFYRLEAAGCARLLGSQQDDGRLLAVIRWQDTL